MISSLKRRLKKFVDQKIKEIKKHQNQTQQIVLDYAQISRLFSESTFIPFTGWSISPSVILHILNDIVINNRRNIIEFGAGASTLYIAKLIQTLKLDAKFYSVESNADWLKKMEQELALYNLQDIVTLIHAPLTEPDTDICLNEQELWYDSEKITAALGGNAEVDLIVVDGPYGGSTPFARYSAVPFLHDRLSKNHGIFRDDTRRDDEDQIAKHWSKILDLPQQKFNRYTYFTSDASFGTAPYTLSKL